MKSRARSIALAATVVVAPSLRAATLAVLPGGSIQEKVDLAQPGDIVAISGGTYPGDVTVNKAIRLVEMDGHEVTITGNVTFTGVTNAPPFEGFAVGSPGKGLTISNTTGMVLKNIDARQGYGVRVNGASVVSILGGFTSSIEQDGGTLTANGIQATLDFITTAISQKTVCFRANIGRVVQWMSAHSWLGYSSVSRIHFSGNARKFVVVGVHVTCLDVPRPCDYVLLAGSGNNFQFVNSKVTNAQYAIPQPGDSGWGGGYSRAIVLADGNVGFISNNYVAMVPEGGFPNGGYTAGSGVYSSSANCSIYNNIFYRAFAGVDAPFGTASRNNFHASPQWHTERGGVVPSGQLSGDPLFVSGQAPALQSSSPCIDAGFADPIFNDLDGSRNDIGPGGGCLFDPQGWTTTKPVVISFDLAPQQLLRGVDTQVNVTKGLAVGQP